MRFLSSLQSSLISLAVAVDLMMIDDDRKWFNDVI